MDAAILQAFDRRTQQMACEWKRRWSDTPQPHELVVMDIATYLPELRDLRTIQHGGGR